jgi:predicted dehydrogenase
MTSQHAAKKFGIRFAATDTNEILNDPHINTVLILTRHDTHAELVCRALEKGKKVYVEKPLALTEEELKRIKEAHLKDEGWIMVGFNRRFSPAILALKKKLRGGPYTLNYRINAGPLAEGHWLHGAEGGGRLLGEGCHFVDLAQYLIGQAPVSVRAQTLSKKDDFQLIIRYRDGSLATITYVTRSDPSFSRERVEIFGDGLSAAIDDFKSGFSRDLGYQNAAQSFGAAVLSGAASPTPFSEIYLSSLTTVRAQMSLANGKEIGLEDVTWA